MTKGFDCISTADVLTYCGMDVKGLLEILQCTPDVLLDYKGIVVHMGTNNFGSKMEWQLFLSFVHGNLPRNEFMCRRKKFESCAANMFQSDFELYYYQLICFIRSVNVSAKILCSAIIPRPWDEHIRSWVRQQFNEAIRKIASQCGVLFLATYRVFFQGYSLKEDYFAYIFRTKVVLPFSRYLWISCLKLPLVKFIDCYMT